MVQSQSGSLRGLKALVAFLGILVVLGTAVVVSVVVKRLFAPLADPASAPPAVVDPAVSATLPPGARILGLAGAGGRFAVWVATPSGGQIYLLDPATGALHLAVRSSPSG